MSQSLLEQLASSPLYGANAPYLEALYEQYLRDPQALDASWRQYFDALPGSRAREGDYLRAAAAVPAASPARAIAPSAIAASAAPAALAGEKQAAASRLIQSYSNRGHLIARIDPLGLQQRSRPRVLKLDYAGLTEADLDTVFFTASRNEWIAQHATLREIITRLEAIYCGHIGAEFAHVSDTNERLWLQDEFQLGRIQQHFSAEERRNLLWQLSAAEGLERYLHTKFVGQKRFSLEGADVLIAQLNDLLQQGGSAGIEEFVLGMAHRGRLNVLVNVLGKSPAELISEFEGKLDENHIQGSGDVKYHKGFSSDVRTPGGNVHVALAFNPSHLEIVDPVVEGSVRARQERRNDAHGDKVVPVLMHGDAAFAGQGVVMETLQLSQLRGFRTGGTIHIVVNNQIGFTTSDPRDLRSTTYSSDVAKMIEAPILHVNADYPEDVIFATRLGLRYRQRFHKDVVIDLVSYRRLGHNEADEPAATQPMMYQAIRQHPTARQLYAEQLRADGIVNAGEPEQMVEQYRNALDSGRLEMHQALGLVGNKYTVDWSRYAHTDFSEYPHTGVEPERLLALGQRVVQYPSDLVLHARVAQIITQRARMMSGEVPLDWGAAETLAYASLLEEGVAVRISGQDSARGTFFHRHAVLYDQKSGRRYIPLQHVSNGQPRFTIIDSVLSEEAVLGFEYGYSTTSPDCLVIWEAQFGDFVNGAQVVIDQFISSGEAKWGRLCGLTLFLPHGYEGQGPEHSSARLERFLQLCAENNMQVCVPSTPAQMFHMLRRQMLRSFRKPLIVMTPKSLLRHELSVSSLADLSQSSFANIIDEIDTIDAAQTQRVVFCSGKVYFDLLKARRQSGQRDIAIVRIEQLYPFPVEEYQGVLARYANATSLVWCQEEPQNQGAWFQIRHRLQDLAPSRLVFFAGRPAAAAPATGIQKLHEAEQRRLVETALNATSVDQTLRNIPTPRLTLTGTALAERDPMPIRKHSS
ncbi:MAG: 2-oxoglutarate dehydrogenase E1 component [Steroidobacteraceae bacterium]|jgi:2-oxoglutarate dehydrogenase E1 component